MAIDFKRTASPIAALLLLSNAVLAEPEHGAAQIGRAIQDLTPALRQGSTAGLAQLVRDCYAKQPARSEAVAYCFTLDYSASRLDDAISRRSGANIDPYLSIEKVLTRANRALSAIKIEQPQRGPLIAFWANSTRAMLSWATSDRAVEKPPVGTTDQAKTAVLKLVKTPGQAQVSGLQFQVVPNMRGEPTHVICGYVTERTAVGALTPRKAFVYFIKDQSVNYDNGADDMDREIVKNFCAR